MAKVKIELSADEVNHIVGEHIRDTYNLEKETLHIMINADLSWSVTIESSKDSSKFNRDWLSEEDRK